MKYKILILTVLLLGAINSQTQTKSSFVNTVKGISDTPPEGYVPPLVSNGSLSMLIDYKGGQTQQKYANLTPGIYWAGRKYGPVPDELIPFGHFQQALIVNGKEYKDPVSWEQTLDAEKAIVTCKNDYGNDLSVETVIFTHMDHDLIVIKKKITSKSSDIHAAEIALKYQFTQPGDANVLPRRVKSECKFDEKSQSVRFQYEADGHALRLFKGVISLFADKQTEAYIDNQMVYMSAKMDLSKDKTAEITYYLLFSDSMDGDDYLERANELESKIKQEGFAGLEKSHIEGWEEYHQECFVHLPDAQMERVYNTAQYHLRANATKWSFPVGIYPNHWHGRYFGWDETFCFQALASSNHLSISKRCPEFRFNVLPQALSRVAHYGKPGLFGARYPWETLEDGLEGAPSPYGFWIDHVFHMSNIAVSAWLQYLYSGDLNYLKTIGYPVIMQCARFFVTHMVYENKDGTMYIGKCTDLERIGPAVQNPFMTSCGAIYNLEAAAQASILLNEDEGERARWLHIAGKLRESLPAENNMYVPHLDYEEKSIAALGGLFPYPIFDSDNEWQKNAAYDFVTNGKAFGNMYPKGVSICPWYAGWIAAALSLYGDKTEPVSVLTDAANNSGLFGELFEINEPPEILSVPWFSTAAGNYVYGVNQMLIQCKDDKIWISPAIPNAWEDYAFKLACFGDLTATVYIKKGKIANLLLSPGSSNKEINRTLIIPENLVDMRKLNKKTNVSIETKEGLCFLTVKIKEAVELF
jgi:hypothetical protein